jgi:putative Mg2+ transporter-C (MgtC) family protein
VHLIDWTLFARIALGAALGGVIGYERDLHGRPAGLRTHMLVALAASTFMVISTRFVYFQHYAREDLVAADPSRIAASIVTGIGFLAGGAILRTGISVQGLTTAAGLWLVAAIGMAAGGGMYSISIFVTVVGVLALTILRRFEDKDILRRTVSLTLSEDASVIELTRKLNELGTTVHAVQYDRNMESKTLSVTLDIRFSQSVGVERVLQVVEAEPGVRRAKVDIAI